MKDNIHMGIQIMIGRANFSNNRGDLNENCNLWCLDVSTSMILNQSMFGWPWCMNNNNPMVSLCVDNDTSKLSI